MKKPLPTKLLQGLLTNYKLSYHRNGSIAVFLFHALYKPHERKAGNKIGARQYLFYKITKTTQGTPPATKCGHKDD